MSDVPKAPAEDAAADGTEEDGNFPAQVEDVNGDLMELDPNDWKLIDDAEPLEFDGKDDDDHDLDGDGGGGDGVDEDDMGEEGEHEPIVVEYDHSAQTMDGHGGEPVYSIAINPKIPNLAVSGGGDDNAVLWDVVTGEKKFHLTGHTDSISAVEFSKNGAYAATASYDSTIKIWNARTGACVQTLEGPDGDVEWITWHKNADVLLAGSKDGTVWMWLAPAGKFMQVFAGHEDEVTCGMFAANGKSVITASLDRTCRVWNPKDGKCRHQFLGYQFHKDGIVSMDVHHSKPLVATGALDGSVRISQFRKGKILHALDQPDVKQAIETLHFARTHDWLASGGLDGKIDVWDVGSGVCRCRFDNQNHNVVKLRWHDTSPLLFSASADAVVKVWDTRSSQPVAKLTGHADVILCMDMIFDAPLEAPAAAAAAGTGGGADGAPSAAAGALLSYLLTASDDGIVKRFQVPDVANLGNFAGAVVPAALPADASAAAAAAAP